MITRVFHPETDENAIAEAAEILRRGGLLGIPTETVYGLGADGLNADAVARIFEAKGRPQDNPLILHVPSADWLERFCRDVPERAHLTKPLRRTRGASWRTSCKRAICRQGWKSCDGKRLSGSAKG